MELFLLLLVQGIANGCHYALLGLGFGLIFGTTNIVHFAFGVLFALAAYATWAAAALLGLPIVAAALVGVVTGAVLGGLTYVILYRPFEVKNAPIFVVMIASLGFGIFLENLLGIVAGTDTKVLTGVENPTHIFEIGSSIVFVNNLQILQVVALVVICIALYLFLRLTSYGKAILAMTDNPEMARIIGIDTFKVTLLVFVLGTAIASVPAALILAKDGATTSMGFNAVFIAFVAVIVGGVGSLPGAVLGGLLVGLVESIGMMGIPTEWQSTIAFIVLFLVLVFRPTGLFKGT
jgi:branched-chain amino acid transport system permease protein